MTDRQRLPNRRRQRTRELIFDGQRFFLWVGFSPETRLALEVFVEAASRRDEGVGRGPRVGTGLHLILQDWAVTASLALQHGARPADLAKSLARVPAKGSGPFEPAKAPASLVGALLDLLAEIEAEQGQELGAGKRRDG